MEINYWMIRAKISSARQAKFFGKYGAWRPYLFAIIESSITINEDLIRQIIINSYYDIPIQGVKYTKYFNLDENSTFDFQYARVISVSSEVGYKYDKFRTIII